MTWPSGVIRRVAHAFGRRQFVAAAGAAVVAALRPGTAAAVERPCTGALADWKKHKCLEGLDAAFEFLQRMKVDELVVGDLPIAGQDVVAKIQKGKTKPLAGSRLETHRKFIDVHYLAKGQEAIGFVPTAEGLEVLQPFDAAKDIGFFARPATATLLPVREGHFAVFLPGEGHAPGLDLDGPHEVLKVVVKISAEWAARRRGK